MNRVLSGLFARIALVAPGGYSLRPQLHRLRGARIAPGVWISQGVYIDEIYPEGVTIEEGCTIGLRASILAHFHWGGKRATAGYKPVVIEKNVFLGPHCVVLPGIRIGEGSVIKAGSVVARNVPPRVFWGEAAGGPLARITVPLGADYPYEDFVRGLRPIAPRAKQPAETSSSPDAG